MTGCAQSTEIIMLLFRSYIEFCIHFDNKKIDNLFKIVNVVSKQNIHKPKCINK